MRRFFLLIGFVLLGCSPFLGAQQNQSAAPARYSLEGVVTNSMTGEPIVRALVEVSGKGAVLTGPDGRFKFSGLLAGTIGIGATKPGFYGNRIVNYIPGGRVSSVPSEEKQSIVIGPDTPAVQLALIPLSVITGTVQNSDGNAIEDAVVRVLQPAVVEGRKRWQQVGFADTDENGRFRIAKLQAGRYLVAVLAGSHRPSLDDFFEASNTGYPAVVYYPASPDRTSALPLEIKPGEKLEIPFELKKVPVFKVSGSLSGPANKAYVPVQLSNADGDETALVARYTPASATFEFNAVPAGSYRLSAGNGPRAEVSLNVERDITDLSIALQPAISAPVTVRPEFTGKFAFLSQTSLPAAGLVYVRLHEVGGNQEDSSHDLDVTKEGSLKLNGLWPGKYFLEFTAAKGYVYSARCGSTDLLREPLTIAEGMPPIEVTLRDNSGSLTVKLISAEAYPRTTLLIVSDVPGVPPRLLTLSDRVQEVNFPEMAPGQYAVFAFDRIDQVEYRKAEALDQYAIKSSHVTIMPGNEAKATVEVIHTPE